MAFLDTGFSSLMDRPLNKKAMPVAKVPRTMAIKVLFVFFDINEITCFPILNILHFVIPAKAGIVCHSRPDRESIQIEPGSRVKHGMTEGEVWDDRCVVYLVL